VSGSRNKEHAAITRQLTAFPHLRDVVAGLERINVDYDAFGGAARANLMEAHEHVGKAAARLTKLGRGARRVVAAAKAEQELLTQQHYAMTVVFAELRKIVQEAGAAVLGALQGHLAEGTAPGEEITAIIDEAVELMAVLPDRFGACAEHHDPGVRGGHALKDPF
jgi:hypothetical protein